MKTEKKLSRSEKWILLGAPVLFLSGSFLHFLYDWTGGSVAASLISAVNESTWEHMKLTVLPTVLWWGIYFFARRDRDSLSANRWFTAYLVSLLVSLSLIPLLFYTVTCGLGVFNDIVYILIFFVSVCLGQLTALHIYKYSDGVSFVIPAAVTVIIVAAFIIFTFSPPMLPLFEPPVP